MKVIKTDVNVGMSEGKPRVCGRSEGGHAVTEEDAGTEDVTPGGSSSERKASLCIAFRNAVFVLHFSGVTLCVLVCVHESISSVNTEHHCDRRLLRGDPAANSGRELKSFCVLVPR